MNRIRILIFDDHAMIRESLDVLLSTQNDFEVVGNSGDGSKAAELFHTTHPDVVLMDLAMPEANGISAADSIIKKFPDARIIMLTMHGGEEDIHRALKIGVKGYILKESMSLQLFEAIRAVHAGRRFIPPLVAERFAGHISASDLTDRELEILKRIAAGQSNKQIAIDLSIAEPTVKGHVGKILSKLHAGDRTEAVTIALRKGIIHFE
jgi:DNA-binding NarL/FixJ family response regulator